MTRSMAVYQHIGKAQEAMHNCVRSGNEDWRKRWATLIQTLIDDGAPHGSGFDAGTQYIDDDRDDRIIFETSFHHMDESGYYDGWTDHRVIVEPSWDGCDIRVTGRDKNDIKRYIAETFSEWLNSVVERPVVA